MKKRQRMKIFKIVATRLKRGEEIHPMHQRVIHHEASEFLRKLYDHEFRPWWYKQDWSEHPLKVELPKFTEQAERRFGEWSGIDIYLWEKYWTSRRVVKEEVK